MSELSTRELEKLLRERVGPSDFHLGSFSCQHSSSSAPCIQEVVADFMWSLRARVWAATCSKCWFPGHLCQHFENSSVPITKCTHDETMLATCTLPLLCSQTRLPVHPWPMVSEAYSSGRAVCLTVGLTESERKDARKLIAEPKNFEEGHGVSVLEKDCMKLAV